LSQSHKAKVDAQDLQNKKLSQPKRALKARKGTKKQRRANKSEKGGNAQEMK
jgi:hypothetical protein